MKGEQSFREIGPQRINHRRVAEAMKSVALETLVMQRIGDRIALRDWGICGVKGGVEAGALRQIGRAPGERPDGGDGMRVVQRRERGAGVDLRQNLWRDASRRGEAPAAMHHAVPRAVERPQQNAASLEVVEQAIKRRLVVRQVHGSAGAVEPGFARAADAEDRAGRALTQGVVKDGRP